MKNFVYRNKQPEDVVVGVGMADLEDQSLAVHAAEKIIVHEKFTSKKFKYFYNIALIRVKEKIVFNARVQPVVLPKSDNLEGGFSAVVTGWGAVRIYPLRNITTFLYFILLL